MGLGGLEVPRSNIVITEPMFSFAGCIAHRAEITVGHVSN